MIELMRFTEVDFGAAAELDPRGAPAQDGGAAGPAVTVTLTGNADHAAIEPLDRVLAAAHAAATEHGAREVAVDLRRLEFMNSSCIKSLVTWISDVRELPAARQYQIRFRSDPAMHWQKRSLHALRCFAVELITIET